ncbi:sulfatase [Galbibacter sp. BG1]|uniref:sulfatase family protein n=1 Tax=Galbibacter sp. BG1 TaxID=1170699 RepID=UPI0015BDF2C9|nr:sulfatase [Galbibacter sp. BG1]QLE01421.1 sulfatase [Galbibacter sp. BG1]
MIKFTSFFTLLLLFSFNISSQNAPNVIIFIGDDISWDDFGCYGNPYVQTPNIDKLAAEGIKFNNFYLTASSCSPSRNSIITGRYPHNTGAAELHTEPPIWMKSFPEILKENDYYTAQAGKFHIGEYAKRGFSKVSLKENGDGGERKWVEFLQDRPKDKPFFMWFAAFDAHRGWGENEFSNTHNPKDIEPPFYLADSDSTKVDLARYYDEIKRFDHYIGKVVDELENQDELDNTLIIVMADNGRPFPHSKTRVNDRGMKSPFIVFGPKNLVKRNAESNALVSAIDIAPTILDFAKAPIDEQFQGVSFKKVLKKPSTAFRNHVFAEHNWHDYEAYERMVRTKDFMYIFNARPEFPQSGPADAVGSPSYKDLLQLKENRELSAIQADIFVTPRPSEELYDMKTDSIQLLNVASVPSYKNELQKMKTALKMWMETTGDNIPKNLTKDWYERKPDYVKTPAFEVRGEMPGSATEAIKNNNKGAF